MGRGCVLWNVMGCDGGLVGLQRLGTWCDTIDRRACGHDGTAWARQREEERGLMADSGYRYWAAEVRNAGLLIEPSGRETPCRCTPFRTCGWGRSSIRWT